ncbi:MAG: hypothetical protein QXM38_04665 [Candidatus Aenigmatarchaeota archaeon]
MQKETQSLKSLSHSYNVNLNKLYYLSSRKKYSKNKIKKTVFEEKYGKGDHAINYYNYFLPRFINKKNNFKQLKDQFFTDYQLSNILNPLIIEVIWEKIMNIYLKVS